MKQIALFVPLVLLAFAPCAHAVENVVVSVNATDDPAAPDNWSAADVGWLYTPSTTFTVTDLGTEFGSTGPIVTAQIFSGLPSGGGTLLASGTLSPEESAFAFATLDNAVTLVANTTYFIGFEDVGGVGVNVTSNVGATSLGSLHFDMVGDGSYSAIDSNATDLNSQPILEFADNAGLVSTPEPSTWALLFGSLATLAVLRRIRSTARN